MTRWALIGAGALIFAILATANSGGYRFGVSDQAFYEPAVVEQLHPALYPRDRPLLQTEARFMAADEILAGVARVSGLDLPPVFLAVYLLTLLVLFGGAVALARAYGLSWWAAAVFVLLLTFRHRIAKTGANSLEGYTHPRELAFALGVVMLACAARRRFVAGAAVIAAAALLHPTTAIWFAIVLVAAAAWSVPAARIWLAIGTGLSALILLGMLVAGPLAGRLVPMDDAWLAVLAGKDYLFPTAWPAYAWALNLLYPLVLALGYRQRRARGVAAPGEAGIVTGFFALFAIFLISVPLTAVKLALAVQLQITRVLWLLDLGAVLYVAWWITGSGYRRPRLAIAAAAILATLSAARGVYMLGVEREDHRLVVMTLPATPWIEAMTWLRTQPADWLVLADPGQAYKYGISVRVGAERDTVLEASKDASLAIYDRAIAMRVADRTAALNGYPVFSTSQMQALHQRYGADVVVVERSHTLALPVLYRNGAFVVYDLR